MKKFMLALLILLVTLLLMLPQVFAQNAEEIANTGNEKRAQTGFKFLSISLDARAAAMADAMTAMEDIGAMAMFYNPSTMARLDNNVDASFGQVKWIADINYNLGAVAFRTSAGVFGINLTSVDYGEFIGTRRDVGTEAGYIDTGNFSPSALAVGIGYALAVSDKFAVGAGVKYARQNLGTAIISLGDDANPQKSEEFAKSKMAFDFGIAYRTGFRSLNFAMSVRNFATEVTYVQESFELPLTFNIGLSMNLMDLTNADKKVHSFMLNVDTNKPRDFDSQVRVGGEYTFMNLLHLRAGYVTPADEQALQLGGGVSKDFTSFGFALDYAYTSFGVFENVNRIGVRLSF